MGVRKPFRVPQWVTLLLIFLLAFVAVNALQPLAYFAAPMLFTFLILFPGKHPRGPRLVRFFPWLLGLELFFSVSMLAGMALGVSELQRLPVTPVQLGISAVSAPLLLWTFVKRARIFFPLLFVASAAAVAESARTLMEGGAAGTNSTVESWLVFLGEVSGTVILAVYLWLKAPETRERNQ